MAVVTLIAAEDISSSNAVYVTAGGKVAKAIATSRDTASVAGFALNAAATDSLVRVDVDGVAIGFTGLIPGAYRYLSLLNPGQLCSFAEFSTDITAISTDGFLTNVGQAVSPTSVSIAIEPPQAIPNPNSFLLMESSDATTINALLLENGSFIDLETAV